MDFSTIDNNFATQKTQIGDFIFYPADSLCLEGFPWFNENSRKYKRLTNDILDNLNEGLAFLSNHTSGGVVRFRTDSSKIAIRSKLTHRSNLPHMPLSGEAGFDLYIKCKTQTRLINNFRPVKFEDDFIIADIETKTNGHIADYILYFPLYAGVEEINIGITREAIMQEPTPHPIDKPILFYGSSITQGACASRPGNAYTAILTRELDAHMINLGFSGNAKGERIIAKKIAELDLSALVIDYDHNAPTAEFLKNTHQSFFNEFRLYQPTTPVILVSRPFGRVSDKLDAILRRDIIMDTYLSAKKQGDNNVYFVDGMTFYSNINRDSCTVDLCHPNDLGFHFMAKGILPTLKDAISLSY